jgi:hypothetical protein
MGISSLRGVVGVGIQSALGTPATSFTYFPALSANVTGEQIAQALPPEVGGSLFSRGSYKGGVLSRGEVSFVIRPNLVGPLLRSLFAQETVTAVNGQTGRWDHLFRVGDHLPAQRRWLTVRRYVGPVYGEQISDAAVGQFNIEVAATNVANATVQLVGRQWDEIAADPSISAATGDFFQATAASVQMGGNAFIVDRATISIGAELTDNEFTVGSYYLDEITMLRRMATITADVRIRNRDLMARVYRNNAAAPTGTGLGAWSPVIFRTSFTATFVTSENPPQQLVINFPSVDLLTLNVQMQGNELIRAQLQGNVSLTSTNYDAGNPGSDTLQPIFVTLRNNREDPY